jgi:hypothetical protein
MKHGKLEDQRRDGENSYNSGDGTGQRNQAWTFMMMMKHGKYGHKCIYSRKERLPVAASIRTKLAVTPIGTFYLHSTYIPCAEYCAKRTKSVGNGSAFYLPLLSEICLSPYRLA